MSNLQTYAQQVDELMAPYLSDGEFALSVSNEQEGKRAMAGLRQVKRELAFVKKQINAEMAQVRTAHADARAKVGHGVGGMIGLKLFGRKASATGNQIQREHLRGQKDNLLAPYDRVRNVIDNFSLGIDRAIVQLQGVEW